MKSDTNKTPELLAPAGDISAALTAFDHGADAVYAGLSKFNARERTENFTIEEMSKLIAYARKINKKVYLTFNTLVKESELPNLVAMLADVSTLAPDAVIVQDLGVLRIIREYFPNLKIHASTQMGIHNSAGMRMAKELGVERVILERQLTTDELSEITRKSELEVEVFIHGALCCSLSGACLFSSWLGGCSGNRGKCKQPCRRRYFGKDGNGFFFSTKDLYSLEMIPELKRMGISSFKIEGRLRKPDYVKSVVSAYRMMLDAPADKEKEIIPLARAVLAGALGRKWSDGFRTPESCASLIQHDYMGVSGLLCGIVKSVEKRGFAVNLIRRLHLGDRIRVQPNSGDEGPAMTVTKMSVDGEIVRKASKKQDCFIFCDKDMPKGKVFKIGEGEIDMSARIAALPLLKKGLDICVEVSENGFAVTANEEKWEKEIELAKAETSPLSEDKLKNEFAITCSDFFRCGAIDSKIEGSLFVPASVLREVRREFWEWAEKYISANKPEFKKERILKKFSKDLAFKKSKVESVRKDTRANGKNSPKEYTAVDIFRYSSKVDEIILPPFCPDNLLPELKEKIEKCHGDGIRRFRVTSIYGIDLLKDLKDIKLVASYPFPVANSMAVREISKYPFVKAQAWLELEKAEMENLVNDSPLPIEIYRYGRPSLFSTRAAVAVNGEIKDSRGGAFTVVHQTSSGIVHVYAKEAMSIPPVEGTTGFYDMTRASVNERGFSRFNFEHELT